MIILKPKDYGDEHKNDIYKMFTNTMDFAWLASTCYSLFHR